MRRIVVNEFLSLDGVAQAPGGATEDTDGGFNNGGWHMPSVDETAGQWVQAGMLEAGGFLLGRRTYDIFAGFWPQAPEEEQEYAVPLNTKPKYVVSQTLAEPLAWHNSAVVRGDLAREVTDLKRQDGGDLHVIGSTRLVQALFAHDLVDEIRLMIDPVVLGGGKRVFPDDGFLRAWRLSDSKVTGTGSILAIYGRDAG